MKFNFHGILSALVTAFGVAGSPAVMGILPPKYAAAVAGIGLVYAAFSKPAVEATPAAPSSTPTP